MPEDLRAGLRAARGACLRVAELEALAWRDSLTGLWNRRAFERIGGLQLAQARRYRFPVSLILLDLDDFKAVNDQRGHAAGDRLLQAVASALQQNSRDSDLVARWGGDEFALLLPQTGAGGARAAAERLRAHAWEAARRALPDADPLLTLSSGVASTELADDFSLAGLFQHADACLYHMKAV